MKTMRERLDYSLSESWKCGCQGCVNFIKLMGAGDVPSPWTGLDLSCPNLLGRYQNKITHSEKENSVREARTNMVL